MVTTRSPLLNRFDTKNVSPENKPPTPFPGRLRRSRAHGRPRSLRNTIIPYTINAMNSHRAAPDDGAPAPTRAPGRDAANP
ncbi:hypothetical protein EVAR_81400_1 [Eumeta japonica]|uniref:Uncharacterized protein n=1 Tax=Eumeta variegata TaxID=151549 RepID=A0A4C1WG13_EUMVA|nr:hypothetical protein EVAR_81400_1 [Eumeta japonica]